MEHAPATLGGLKSINKKGLKIKIHIILTKFNVLIRVQTDNSQSNMISFDVEITSAT